MANSRHDLCYSAQSNFARKVGRWIWIGHKVVGKKKFGEATRNVLRNGLFGAERMQIAIFLLCGESEIGDGVCFLIICLFNLWPWILICFQCVIRASECAFNKSRHVCGRRKEGFCRMMLTGKWCWLWALMSSENFRIFCKYLIGF